MATSTENVEFWLKARDDASKKFKTAETALGKLGHKQKKVAKGSKDLSSRFRQMASNASILEGPLGQVAGRLNAVATAFGRINPLVLAGTVLFTAFSVTMFKSVKAAAAYQTQMFKLNGVLKATNGTVGISVGALDRMAIALGEGTLASAEGARDAIARLATFTNISGDEFKRTLGLAQDMTAVFGGDLSSNAVKLARAIDNPRVGLQGLTRQFTAFDKTTNESIVNMFETGQKMEAQNRIIKILTAGVGGAGAAQGQGLSGALDTLGERWTNLSITMGTETGAMRAVEGIITTVSNAIKGLNEFFGAADGRTTEELKAALKFEEKSLDFTKKKVEMSKKRGVLENFFQDESRKASKSDVIAQEKKVAALKMQIRFREVDADVAKAAGDDERKRLQDAKDATSEIERNKSSASKIAAKNVTVQEAFTKDIAEAVRLRGIENGLSEEMFQREVARAALVFQKSGGPTRSDKAAADRAARSLEGVRASLRTEEEAIHESYIKRAIILDQNMEAGAERDVLQIQLAQQHANSLEAIDRAQLDAKLSMTGDIMGMVLSLYGNKSKKMFAIAQSVNTGLAIMNTSTGVTDALKTNNYILAGLTAAKGALEIATIMSQSPSGGAREFGGPVNSRPVLVGERGPEIFTPTGAGRITPNNQLGSGVGDVNLNLTVNATGSEDAESLAQQLGPAVLDIIQDAYDARFAGDMGPLRVRG